MGNNVIEVENVSRAFPVPGGEFWALKKINAQIPEGSFVILKGRSGSGKTTLLNLICTLDKPTEGIIKIDGTDVAKLSDHEKEDMRRTKMGFVFQSVSL
ncbi:MAG: ATP-binding cassette domain-containing protein, partial [Lachnospiraceae bacterium]|nr:ATP-binding cassette domain-containing protein [Lachnospiraceae bacterium]